MLRQSIVRSSRSAAGSIRLFSASSKAMAEGDIGAPKSVGGGDAFSKREKANEDMYVRKQEMEKLKLLQTKLAEQKKNITDLEKDIENMVADGDKK